MKLYHLDRYAAIRSGYVLDLFPLNCFSGDIAHSPFWSDFSKGISSHGVNLFRNTGSHIDTLSSNGELALCPKSFVREKVSVDVQIIETVFELVRRAYFPKLPSRFVSFFAVRRRDDFLQWPELCNPSAYPNQRIFEIDAPDDAPRFDSSFLRGGLTFRHENGKYFMGCFPASTADLAYRYWSGEISDKPRMEYLISLPIRAEQYREVNYCLQGDPASHQP